MYSMRRETTITQCIIFELKNPSSTVVVVVLIHTIHLNMKRSKQQYNDVLG